MLGLLRKLFGGKPAEQTAEAPYKVEVPVVETAPTPVSEKATQAVVESIPTPAPKKKAAPKKAAAPKQGGTKKGGRKPKSTTQA